MELTSSNSTSVFDSLGERIKMPPIETFVVSREDPNQWSRQMVYALRTHWPEYFMEATELGLFMIAACSFIVLLSHPDSPVAQAVTTEPVRRLLMGTAMAVTAIAIIFSPLA